MKKVKNIYYDETKEEKENEFYICLGRMAKKYRDGNYFDIYFGMDKQGALDFGRQELLIKIYD